MGEILGNLATGFVNAVQPLNFLMIVGGLVSALFLAFFAPPFARFALSFSTVEFFSVVVFGLASVSVLGQSSMAAALVSLFSGMFLGTIGTEAQYGVERFAFGIPFLK